MRSAAKFITFMAAFTLILIAAEDPLSGQVKGLVRITSVSNSQVILKAGSPSVTITATGRNLHLLTNAAVLLGTRPVSTINAILLPPERNTRRIMFSTHPAAVPDTRYQLRLIQNTTHFDVPLSILRISVVRPVIAAPKISVAGDLTYNDNSLLPGTKDTVFPALRLRSSGANIIGASVKVNGTALPEVRDGYYAVSRVDAPSRQVEVECQSPPSSLNWTVFVHGKFEDSWRVTTPSYGGTHILRPGGSLRLRWSGPSRAVDINIYNGSSRIYLKRNVTGNTHDIPNSMLPVSDSLRIMIEVFNVANPLYRGDYARDSDVDLHYRSFTYIRTQKPERP